MMKVIGPIAVLVLAGAGCCVPTAREQGASSEAPSVPVQGEPQPGPDPVPSAQPAQAIPAPNEPGWVDPPQVAGAEHGAAAGLTFQRIFEIDQLVWLHRRDTKQGDHAVAVAKAEGVSVDVVDAAVAAAGKERTRMEIYLGGKPHFSHHSGTGALSTGISATVADIGAPKVENTDIGPRTVFSLVTLHGCPERADLAKMAQEVVSQMVANIPSSASGLRVNIWYSGSQCRSDPYGKAVYDASTGSITFQ